MQSRKSRDTGGEGGRIAGRIIAELDEAPGNAPGIRAVRKRFSKQLAGADRETVLSVAQELIRRARFGRFVGYELIHYHDAAMHSLTEKEVNRLGEGMNDWGGVDTFACYVAGPAWRAGRIGDQTIARWARSQDRWRRRAALVSTVPLNARKPPAPEGVKQTLAICLMLASDRDDMVVKAMSWALRALAARDPASARAFLAGHQDKLAARVIREVQNKLSTGLKNPRKARSAAAAPGNRTRVSAP